MVPEWKPFHVVSTNVRTHNQSLGVENVVIEALDHNWKVCGLVPSIVFICDISDSIKSSFCYRYTATKEKVFEKSELFHHATELTNYSSELF